MGTKDGIQYSFFLGSIFAVNIHLISQPYQKIMLRENYYLNPYKNKETQVQFDGVE